MAVSRFRPWPWRRSCRMGPPLGALPKMRMAASWLRSQSIHRIQGCLRHCSAADGELRSDHLGKRRARQSRTSMHAVHSRWKKLLTERAPYKGGKAQRIPPVRLPPLSCPRRFGTATKPLHRIKPPDEAPPEAGVWPITWLLCQAMLYWVEVDVVHVGGIVA